jgi:hypothetical protein
LKLLKDNKYFSTITRYELMTRGLELLFVEVANRAYSLHNIILNLTINFTISQLYYGRFSMTKFLSKKLRGVPLKMIQYTFVHDVGRGHGLEGVVRVKMKVSPEGVAIVRRRQQKRPSQFQKCTVI